MTAPTPRSSLPTALILAVCLPMLGAAAGRGEDYVLHEFKRQQLSDVYYSEGIGVGDLNRDGKADVVYGPYWFAGPDFKEKREIFAPKPQNREGYADHFFAWVHDFNGDGLNDILTAGFPGTPGFVYENPGLGGFDKHWKKHTVFPQVCNESPHFVDIVGDKKPELVCSKGGYFGYATFDPARPFEEWTFHAVSDKVAPVPFGHGLGVGDVNGDGRMDLLTKDGYFLQPASLEGDPKWVFHAARFAPIGGADIHAYDVDGDGDNDVITSLAAHDFGLAWHEQAREEGRVTFRQHLIMGDQPSQNRYGLVFSEPHSVKLADIDGDGLKDIVTGKTYYSHHKQSPMWDAGAVVYWFRLVRGRDGVDWVPHKADGESGIGRQFVVTDIDGDGKLDLAAGGMKGAHVLMHKTERVDAKRWEEAQPKVRLEPPAAKPRGPRASIEERSGRVAGAVEGETLVVLGATAGKTSRQNMAGFKTGRWSGDEQLLWSGAQPGARLDLELDVPAKGTYDVVAVLTSARDYGIVRMALDGATLREPFDLYNYPEVVSTGELTLGRVSLDAGKHRLSVESVGANASALRAYLLGIDYVRLVAR